jgi:hypothetical protein
VKNHKALPAGSQPWARDINTAVAKIAELEGIIRRMANDFGLDYSNPKRGVNTGSVPSVKNPVMLKLPALQDLDIRDAVDGDVLTFDASRGVWVARALDAVQLPKVHPEGDPDSYYTPDDDIVLADTWSETSTVQNLYTDPALTTSTTGMTGLPWVVYEDDFNPFYSQDVVSITNVDGHCEVFLDFWADDSNGTNIIEVDNLPPNALFIAQATLRDLVIPPGAPQPTLLPHIDAEMYYYNATGGVVRLDRYDNVGISQTSLDWQRIGAWVDQQSGSAPGPITKAKLRLWLTLPWRGSSSKFLLDNFMLLSAHPLPYGDSNEDYYFDGNSTDTNEIAYSWDGTPNNSTSTAQTLQRLKYPANVPAGSTMQVLGEGFMPNAFIYLSANGDGEFYEQELNADSDGTFETTITLSPDEPPAEAYLYAYDYDSGLNANPDTTFNITE